MEFVNIYHVLSFILYKYMHAFVVSVCIKLWHCGHLSLSSCLTLHAKHNLNMSGSIEGLRAKALCSVIQCCPAWQLVWSVCHYNELRLSTWFQQSKALEIVLLRSQFRPQGMQANQSTSPETWTVAACRASGVKIPWVAWLTYSYLGLHG